MCSYAWVYVYAVESRNGDSMLCVCCMTRASYLVNEFFTNVYRRVGRRVVCNSRGPCQSGTAAGLSPTTHHFGFITHVYRHHFLFFSAVNVYAWVYVYAVEPRNGDSMLCVCCMTRASYLVNEFFTRPQV